MSRTVDGTMKLSFRQLFNLPECVSKIRKKVVVITIHRGITTVKDHIGGVILTNNRESAKKGGVGPAGFEYLPLCGACDQEKWGIVSIGI